MNCLHGRYCAQSRRAVRRVSLHHAPNMKIATWNVNSLKVRLPHLLRWLETNPVDVLCIQETKLTDDKFPVSEINAAGYQVAFTGQKTYNGVAILSRLPIEDVVKNNPHFDDPQQRIIAATIDGVRFVNAYIPNGQEVDSDKYVYKMAWLKALHEWLGDELARASAAGAAGRLQYRAGRPRRPRPGRMGRQDPLLRARARGDDGAGRPGPGRRLPPVRAAGKAVQLVGLPDDGFPPQPRPAHRPHPAVAGTGQALHGLHHRPRDAQMGAAVGSRAGDRHADE